MATKSVPVLAAGSLLQFSLPMKVWKSVVLSTAASLGGTVSMVSVSCNRLFVTGAGDPSKDTFTVDSLTGEVAFLQPLSVHRRSIGLIKCDRRIYAFCGLVDGVYKAESGAFDIETARWKALPKAKYPRSAFNPCCSGRNIYLIGGCGTTEAEYFNIELRTFHRLPIRTPNELCTVNVCSGTRLISIQKTGYYTSDISNFTDWKFVPFGFSLSKGFWSSYQVVEYRGELYVCQSLKERIVAVNIEVQSFKEYPFPSLT